MAKAGRLNETTSDILDAVCLVRSGTHLDQLVSCLWRGAGAFGRLGTDGAVIGRAPDSKRRSLNF